MMSSHLSNLLIRIMTRGRHSGIDFNRTETRQLILTILMVLSPIFLQAAEDEQILTCNEGEDFECICNSTEKTPKNLPKELPWCDSFVDSEIDKLEVPCLTVRNVRLHSRVYITNETIEAYIRRRIAQILTYHCQRRPEQCPRKKNRPVREMDLEGYLIEPVYSDKKEWSFSTKNVVFLKINSTGERLDLCFAVTNAEFNRILNYKTMMDPGRTRQTFLNQMAPLSRVLGGIEVEKIKIGTIGKVLHYDNTRLWILIMMALSFLAICWILAIIWILRDQGFWQKFTKNIRDKRGLKNYGSCMDKLSSTSNQKSIPNGKAKTLRITENRNRKSQDQAGSDLTTFVVVSEVSSANSSTLRSYQNMFACDHSQLPKESEAFESEKEEEEEFIRRISNTKSNFESSLIIERRNSNRGDELIASEIQIPICKEPTSNATILCNSLRNELNVFASNSKNFQDERNLLLGTMEDVGTRPLSRRGSWDEAHDQGVEETYSSREDTPQPLGDENSNSNTKEISIPLINIENDAQNFSHIEANDDGNNKKGKEKEKEKAIFSEKEVEVIRSKIINSIHTASSNEASSESESEDPKECHYERLEESPLPSPLLSSIDENFEISY